MKGVRILDKKGAMSCHGVSQPGEDFCNGDKNDAK
ncbi:hypothetical protein COLO4_32053 [Corchorus olitorius]|uniref:Uncharacterized protein n=1 Tax=Corchorus olitorius TaxID=93759 RepID=A0A1R3H262_9ROSI|nr:hypothetical protein COLO4_32053 [Corchorus olitorius]